MIEAITSPSPAHGPGHWGKLSADQLAWRGTWAQIPDQFPMETPMWHAHMVPLNGSTMTLVNPLDPGTIGDAGHPCHLVRPAAYGTLYGAGR
jgi:hypothetical protein